MFKNEPSSPNRSKTVSNRSSKRSTLLSHTDSIFSTLSRASTSSAHTDDSSIHSKELRAYPNILQYSRPNMSVQSSDSIRSAPSRPHPSISASSHDAYVYRSSSLSDPPTPHRSKPPLSRSSTSNTIGGPTGAPLSPPHTPGPRDTSLYPSYPPSRSEKQAAIDAMIHSESSVNVVYASDVTHNFEKGVLSRTKKEYLVLTNQQLLRFKNQQKANQSLDLFASNHAGSSSIPPSSKLLTSKDHLILKIDTIVAVHIVQGAHYSFRIDYMQEEGARQPSSITCSVESSNDRVKWMDRLRSLTRIYLPRTSFMSREDRLRGTERLSKHREITDDEEDIIMHKVLFKEKRLKTDGQGGYKEIFNMINIAIGKFSIYLLPSGISDEDHIKIVQRDRYGLLAIQTLVLDGHDDTIRIKFRQIQSDTKQIELVTCHAEELIHDIRRAIHSLVPLYPVPPYQLVAHETIQNVRILPLNDIPRTDDFGFDRLLEAYCAAFNLNKSRIMYSVEATPDAEDGLSLTLLPANEINETSETYSKFELLAFMQSLRHNTIFRSLSFADVDLSELQSWVSRIEDGWSITTDEGLHIGNVLASELYSLVINNKKLRRLDLSNCSLGGTNLEQSPISIIGMVLQTKMTGLNGILLANNRMSPIDVEALAGGIQVARKATRELSVRGCGLDAMQIDTLLQALYARSPGHLKSLDLSQNAPELSVAQVDGIFRRCNHLEHVALRGCGYGPDLHTLDLTKLVTLDLGLTPLSDEHVLVICQWISSPSFATVRSLHLDGCSLHAGHVRDILIAIARSGNMGIHLDVSQNPIFREVSHLPRLWYAIMQSYTPYSMSFREIEWEENALQEFLDCMVDNQNMVKLDLTGMRLIPSGRHNSVVGADTVKKLGILLERNRKLQEINLSGGVDENGGRVGLGKAISPALSSLAYNTNVTHLILRGVRFGDIGISAIAEVLKSNKTLVYLDIDDNNVTIDGYRILHEALADNTTLISLPKPRVDLRNQLAHLKETITELTLAENESRFFIANSGGSDSRRAKASLQLQLQVRRQAESARARIAAEVEKVMKAIEKNRQLWERVQAQVQLQSNQQQFTPRNGYADDLLNEAVNLFGIGPPLSSSSTERTPPMSEIYSTPWPATGFSEADRMKLRSNSGTQSEHSSVGSQFLPYPQPYGKPDSK